MYFCQTDHRGHCLSYNRIRFAIGEEIRLNMPCGIMTGGKPGKLMVESKKSTIFASDN